MNRSEHDLTLPQEVMLLALHDEKGTVAFGSMLSHALAGAVLSELLLRERITVDHGRRRELVTLVEAAGDTGDAGAAGAADEAGGLPGATGTGDAVLDAALERIRGAGRRASLQKWVERLSGTKGLREEVALQLCRRGVLEEREDRVLLLFRRRVYPTLDPVPERRLVQRLRGAVLGRSTEVEPRTAIVLALGRSVGLLGSVFSKQELRTHKQRIRTIGEGQAVGRATQQAVEAVQAAVVAATTVVMVTSAGT